MNVPCTFIDWITKPDNLTAASTGAIAFFTLVLTLVSSWQACLIRREFIASHRPRVIIRFIEGPEFGEDKVEFISITVANVGGSEAKIIEFGGDLARRDKEKKLWLVSGADGAQKRLTPSN